MISERDLYTSDSVGVRMSQGLAVRLCTERHGYDSPGGRVSVCWPCQVAAANDVNDALEGDDGSL